MLRNISYHPLVFDIGGAGGRFIKTLVTLGLMRERGGDLHNLGMAFNCKDKATVTEESGHCKSTLCI